METIKSSTTPLGDIVDLSTTCNTIMVFLKAPWRLSFNMVSIFITLIVAPRSIKVLGTIMPSMCTSTTRLPRSRYFRNITLPSIRLDSFPTTLMVGVSLFLLPRILKHFSLIIVLYIGTYLMARRRGILIHKLFNSMRGSTSFGVCWLRWINLQEREVDKLEEHSLPSLLQDFRGRRWMIIWENYPRLKVYLLDFHNISRIGCLPTVYLLCLLVFRVRIGLSRHLR